MGKKTKQSDRFHLEQAPETARDITSSWGAADPDPEGRRYNGGVLAFQRHFENLEHAIRSREDWPAVCQAVADARCGLSADELLEGLLMAVRVESGDTVDQPAEPAGPPTPGSSAPLDPAKVLDGFAQGAAFVRGNVPVPESLVIAWDRNQASDTEVAGIYRLQGGVFDMRLTPEQRRTLCKDLDDVLRGGMVLRRFLHEQGKAEHRQGVVAGKDPRGTGSEGVGDPA